MAEHNPSPLATTNNPKKRLLNTNNVDNTIIPDNKKRKFNDSMSRILEANESIKKEINHYKQGLNAYKNEANKWKSKYIELYSHVMSNTVKMTNETAVNNTKDNMKLVASQ
eukprot:433163_1